MVRVQVFCEHCHHETIVYHLDWTHVICSNCNSEVENNLYEEEVVLDGSMTRAKRRSYR